MRDESRGLQRGMEITTSIITRIHVQRAGCSAVFGRARGMVSLSVSGWQAAKMYACCEMAIDVIQHVQCPVSSDGVRQTASNLGPQPGTGRKSGSVPIVLTQ